MKLYFLLHYLRLLRFFEQKFILAARRAEQRYLRCAFPEDWVKIQNLFDQISETMKNGPKL